MHLVGTYVHMSLFLACRAVLCVAGNWQELLRSKSLNGQLLGGRHASAEPCNTSCCLGRTRLSGCRFAYHVDRKKAQMTNACAHRLGLSIRGWIDRWPPIWHLARPSRLGMARSRAAAPVPAVAASSPCAADLSPSRTALWCPISRLLRFYSV